MSNSFIEFSIDLPNMALFLNFTLRFLILLPSFFACFNNYVLRSIYDFKNADCLNSDMLLFFLPSNSGSKDNVKFL